MKENIIFKDASKNLIELTDLLQKTIKNTVFENKVYYVGGCVRDLILGREPRNIDIVVNKECGGIEFAIFLAMKLGVHDEDMNPYTYSQCGASLEIYNNKNLKDFDIRIEQTRKSRFQYDKDGYKELYGTLEEDSKCRDFTINGLYWNISQESLYDFSGLALQDLKKRIIRCTSTPSLMFFEDPSRILRAVRFANEEDWGIESDTWLGMIKMAKELETAYVMDCFTDIMTLDKPSTAIKRLYNCGALEYLAPDVNDLNSVKLENGSTLLDKTLMVVDETTPNTVSRLGALFHSTDEIIMTNNPSFAASVAKSDIKSLGYPERICNDVETTIKYYSKFDNYGKGVLPTDRILRKFINRCGDCLYNVIDLMSASYTCRDDVDKGKPLALINAIKKLQEKEKKSSASSSPLPINGNDIIKEFNLKKGPHIGILIKYVRDEYSKNKSMTKDECFDLVREKLKTLAV